jgi:hypothetical protein
MTNACPKPGTGFPTSYVVFFFVFSEWRWEMIVRFVDIWWNCWPSLLKLSFYKRMMMKADTWWWQWRQTHDDDNEGRHMMMTMKADTWWWQWRQTHDDDNEGIVMKTIHMVAWTLRCDSTGGILLAIRKRENNVIRL